MNVRPEWDEGEKVDFKQPAAYRAPTRWTGPDYPERIKQKYFGPREFSPFPSWIYHPDLPGRIVQNAQEAAEYDVVYRKATDEERLRYQSPEYIYDCSGEWRVKPYAKDTKFDPQNLQPGKILVHQLVDHARRQAELMEVLVRNQGGGAPTEMQVLREQLAKQQEMLDRLLKGDFKPRDIQSKVEPEVTATAHKNALTEILSDPDLKQNMRDRAEALGIEVDGRWSVKRIEQEIEKVVALETAEEVVRSA